MTNLENGVSEEKKIPIKRFPPQNPNSHLMCFGLINLRLLVHVLSKDKFPIPPS